MRKRVPLALPIVLVSIAGILALRGLREPDPVYKGKPLSAWLEQYYRSLENPDSPMTGGGTIVGVTPDDLGGEESAKEAEMAIRAVGASALPVLLRMAKVHDSVFRRQWIVVSYRQSVIPAQWRTDYAYRGMATWGFFILGPAAKPAVPTLARLLDDQHADVRVSIVQTLGSMGNAAQDAIPALVNCLRHKDADTRLAAAEALKQIDPEAAARAGVK
jgi:hypothetical protein